MITPRYPAALQINTRVRLSELSAGLERQASLDDISDAELAEIAAKGYDFVWLLGVWQTGDAAQIISRSRREWLEEYRAVLPDCSESDVCGSCFAIQDYGVHREFGGPQALERLRQRLREHGLRLLLDFVPNHVAPDHPWVAEHPDWFVSGTEELLASGAQNYCRVRTSGADRILAYGRDPNFAGWPDTLQLNYGVPALQQAMHAELSRIARQCDGVRCDMAMLVLPEIFARTWGISAAPFWPWVTQAVRTEVPGFLFLAEAYWDLEWTLQQQGFDYTYDKRLYDRLVEGHARPVREHLRAGLDFQDRLVRFIENHDEPRAAATFGDGAHRAAAILTFLSPGLRLFHQGQREGKQVRIPVHLGRGPAEAIQPETAAFYDALLQCLRDRAFRDGAWQLLDCRPAWEENGTWDSFVALSWTGPDSSRHLVAVNYSAHRGQCYVAMPWRDLGGSHWCLRDLTGPAVYERQGGELMRQGLYLEMPAWGYHVFALSPTR